MSNTELLISSRKYVRAQVTRIHNERDFDAMSASEKSVMLVKLKGYAESLKSADEQIMISLWETEKDEAKLHAELAKCEVYTDTINVMLGQLTCSAEVAHASPPPSVNMDTARSMLRSPVAPLPMYRSEEGEDIDRFLFEFESTTSQYKYNDRDKLLLLKQQVTGRASMLLMSLELDRQTYSNAKALLQDGLATPSLKKFNAILKLSKLELGTDEDPFNYRCLMSNLIEAFRDLKIESDDVLQFFIWNGLNRNFKSQMISITNKLRPSLEEIKDNFFEASERYMLSVKNSDSKKVKSGAKPNSGSGSSNSFAVNVSTGEPGKPNCSMCSFDKMDNVHSVAKCPIYLNSDAKIKKLKEIGACLKCTNLNHNVSMCKFKLRNKCFKCNMWHFSFLCTKGSNGKKPADDFKKKDSKVYSKEKGNSESKSGDSVSSDCSSAVTTEALNCTSSECLLPTFSGSLRSGGNIRGMKDGGCQSTFVSDILAIRNNFKVLKDNISLTINGFNASKSYNSKLVEFEIKLGDDWYLINALTIPSINIRLYLPGLKQVVDNFLSKGYQLADEYLHHPTYGNQSFDIMLGANNSHCILEKAVAYGGALPSVFYETPFGVMFAGSVDRHISNANFLPVSKSQMVINSSFNKLKAFSTVASNSVVCSLPDNYKVDALFAVLDEKGNLVESELRKATDSALNEVVSYEADANVSNLNQELVDYCLDNAMRKKDGRLVMPLLWKPDVKHLLGKSFNLAKAVLRSNFVKLNKKPDLLNMINQTFKEQEQAGIIERVDNLNEFMSEHPTCSFLSHMPVFKLDHDTTKCRVVFLSNISERSPSGKMTLSHNQVMYAGPSLNPKIAKALIQLRFGAYIFCYDVVKAFNQIELNELDQHKLLFLWYKNIRNNDFTLTAYRNVRLSFGLRCSPTILMLGFFKILVQDAVNDEPKLRGLKLLLYDLLYMDNGAFTCDSPDTLTWAFAQVRNIFAPYRIALQKFITNYPELQSEMDNDSDEAQADEVKLLGLNYNRISDTLSTPKVRLNESANTKRLALQTLASQYDLFQFNGPMLNRARLFVHKLQCDRNVGWDDPLSVEKLAEWHLVCKQVNSAPSIKVKRFVGKRSSKYRLIACVDASNDIYGAVVYIEDLSKGTVNFLLAKSKLINRDKSKKTIPALELEAISFGAKILMELKEDLSGSLCVVPIEVESLWLYSDSLVALSWVNGWSNKLDKMNKLSVFAMNRLRDINEYCNKFPITFSFICGPDNPGDCITRCLSYKLLMNSCYFSGPKRENPDMSSDVLTFTVPNPSFESHEVQTSSAVTASRPNGHVVPLDRYSSFPKLVNVLSRVVKCVMIWKKRTFGKSKNVDSLIEANILLILKDQNIEYTSVVDYFKAKLSPGKKVPPIVSQLNLYMDQRGIIRVKAKFSSKTLNEFPILLSKNSTLTTLIIRECHEKLKHAGLYSVLNELRKSFWIPHYFSVVKRVVKACVTCRRYKTRPVKLNQSFYRQFRVDPSRVPFSSMYMDHFGPYKVKVNNETLKAWVLCCTCMYTRAINLKVCYDLTVGEFLRNFQTHVFDYGLPQYVVSDLGSSLVAGSNVITDFLSDSETLSYCQVNNIKPIKFDHYYKGCSALGSMVEVCVRLCKHLIHKSIKNYVLTSRDFEFMILETCHLVNKRPVSLKESIRDNYTVDVPMTITPENLIHGYDLNSFNIIPSLQPHPDIDNDFMVSSPIDQVKDIDDRLRCVRKNLLKLYHHDFLANLFIQATDKEGRYKAVNHEPLGIGDLVLLHEPHTKSMNLPLGIVKSVVVNDLGEITNASVLKGKTGEITRRHVTSLIPLLKLSDSNVKEKSESLDRVSEVNNYEADHTKTHRNAAVRAKLKISKLMADDLV